jgi:tetratricopeptide (TPR) repeat protein
VSPIDDASYAALGRILLNIGRPEEAIGMVEKALRLNPHSVYGAFLGEAYYLTGR